MANLGLQHGTQVDAVALGDAMGDRGLVSECGGTGHLAYQVVQELAVRGGPFGPATGADSSVPGAVASLGVQSADPLSGSVRRQLWLANLTPEPTMVVVEDSDAGKIHLRRKRVVAG